MKEWESESKKNIKLRYAAGLYKALRDSSLASFRKLAEEADLGRSHIQQISSGNKDVSLTTNIAISQALGISYSKLASYYDNVTESDMKEFLAYREEQKKLKGNDKTPMKKKTKR